MFVQTIEVEGKRFVLVEEAEFKRLKRIAHSRRKAGELPPLPEADDDGNRPGLEYILATIARDIARERKALGLTQEQLSKLSGVRAETLSRIESAQHSPTVRTVEKIERALKHAASKRK